METEEPAPVHGGGVEHGLQQTGQHEAQCQRVAHPLPPWASAGDEPDQLPGEMWERWEEWER